MSMALLKTSLFRSALGRPGISALAKSFGASLNISNINNGRRDYSSISSSTMVYVPENDERIDPTKERFSRRALLYFANYNKWDEKMKKARVDFKTGMRHLANMMGVDPYTFTQADANRAVEYLFPSGLFDKRARPFMLPPEKVYPARKAPQFDNTGRPTNMFFYTVSPHFYQLCHDIVGIMKELDNFEDAQIREQKEPDPTAKLVLDGSAWLTKVQLQDEIIEDISDRNYFEYITTMDRLVAHPYSYRAKDFIMKNRRTLSFKENSDPVAIPIVGEDGRSYVTIHRCIRKSAVAEVTTISPGTGKIEINGRDISFFKYDQPRQEVRDNYVNYDEIP